VDGNRSKTPIVKTPPPTGIQAPEVPGFMDYYHAVASAYVLRPYPGSVEIFVSEYAVDNWRWYWRWLVRGGVTFRSFPCEHMDFLLDPDGRSVLAKFLTTVLQRAQQKEQAIQIERRRPHASLVS
jgi:hypothetical protein